MLLVVGKDIVEREPELVLGVEPEKRIAARRQNVHVFERNVAVDGQLISAERGVERREDQRVFDIANAYIAIDAHRAPARRGCGRT